MDDPKMESCLKCGEPAELFVTIITQVNTATAYFCEKDLSFWGDGILDVFEEDGISAIAKRYNQKTGEYDKDY